MNRNIFPLILAVSMVAALVGCAQQAPAPVAVDTRVADEAAVRIAAEGREKGIGSRDVDRILGYYEADGWQMNVGGDIAKTDAERRTYWDAVTKLPVAQLSVDVESNIVVSRAGDIAVRYGTFRQVIATDQKGGTKSVPMKTMVLWRKQADGSWKVAAAINTAPALSD